LGAILDPVAAIGRAVLSGLQAAGAVILFALEALTHLVRPPFYGRLFLRHVTDIGYFSLPVVALTAFFTGMVLALQSYTGFARFNAEGAVANVVVLSITRELGPVIASLMVAGRIGASFAAEIGTMRVTDQIDALTTLSTNPMKYLGGGGRYSGGNGRLADRHGEASLQLGRVFAGHACFPAVQGCGLGPWEGMRLWLCHRADGLLVRL